VAHLRAEGGPGALRRLRCADAGHGCRIGATRSHGPGDRNGSDRAAPRPGARPRHRRDRGRGGRVATGVLRDGSLLRLRSCWSPRCTASGPPRPGRGRKRRRCACATSRDSRTFCC
jgi:hypothetical protein